MTCKLQHEHDELTPSAVIAIDAGCSFIDYEPAVAVGHLPDKEWFLIPRACAAEQDANEQWRFCYEENCGDYAYQIRKSVTLTWESDAERWWLKAVLSVGWIGGVPVLCEVVYRSGDFHHSERVSGYAILLRAEPEFPLEQTSFLSAVGGALPASHVTWTLPKTLSATIYP